MINTNRMVSTFLDYVKIDSESYHELEMCDFLYNQLVDLGFDVVKTNVDNNIGSNGYNIIAKYKGDPNKKPIFMNAHTDTVSPGKNITPVIDGDIIKSDGTTILGADSKAGIAIIVETMRALKENNVASRPIDAVFTLCEEVALLGANILDVSLFDAREGIVLDAGGAIGGIVTKAPGHQLHKVKITGKPSHSGAAPEAGISAIQIAARAINKMQLGRIDFETTANVGQINGGMAMNIIPGEVNIISEARSLNAQKMQAQTDKMQAAFEEAAKHYGGEVEFNAVTSYPAVDVPKDAPIIKDIEKAFADNGIEPYFKVAGGGSDNNVFFGKGIQSVDLAIAYENIHGLDECIRISDMEKVARVVYSLCE